MTVVRRPWPALCDALDATVPSPLEPRYLTEVFSVGRADERRTSSRYLLLVVWR
jgi:hypothetical protein